MKNQRKLLHLLAALTFIASAFQLPASAEKVEDFQPNSEWLQSYKLMRREWSQKIPAGGPTTLKTPDFNFFPGDMWAALCFRDSILNPRNVEGAVWVLNYPGFKTVTRRYTTRFATNASGTGNWTVVLENHSELICEVRSINALDLQP